MANYKAVFSKPRRIASAISSYFVRSSSGTDRATSGTYSTVSSGTPAFDRKDGLILEASRTNLVTYSDQIDHASWSKTKCSVNANSEVSLDGGANADVVVEDSSSGTHEFAQGFTLAADTSVVVTMLVKRIVGSRNVRITAYTASHGLRATFNLDTLTVTNGSFGTSTFSYGLVEAAGSGWYWLTLVGKPSATETNPTLGVNLVSGTSTTSYVGDGVSSLSFWRVGAEVGTFRSSSIQTVASTVTRAASYIGGGSDPLPFGSLGLLSQTNEYSGHIVIRPPFPSTVAPDSTQPVCILAIGRNAGAIHRVWLQFATTAGSISVQMHDGTTTHIATASGLTWSAGQTLNLRFSKGATNGLILVAQSTVATNTSAGAKAAFPYAMDGVQIGKRTENAVATSYGTFSVVGFRVWDTALSQAQLEALTTADLDGSTYLTSWSTELGSDPPATVTISDENITTGSLDWWRFGESADTSENTKSASYATYLSGSANINTPAFGRYAGSTDKQAPLITYSDGTSPSSGSSRAYASTGVASAGRRNVVTSQGKPLWIHILAGGYDGVHQHVLTTSDSSSPVHTRTNTTGATTVKFWETIVYWGGANGSTLQIDSTAVSGSVGLQLAAITVFPVDPTIVAVSPTSPYPGQSVTATMLGMAEVATTATYDGAASPTVGSPTLTSVPLTWPARSTFRFAGTHASVRFGVNKNLVIGNGYESSAGYGVSTTAEQLAGFGARDSGAAAYDLGTWNSGAITLATSDEVWGHVTVGSAAVNAPAVDFTPYEDPTTVEWTYFDISAGSWSGLTTTTFTDTPSLTMADTTLTPGQTVRATMTGGPFAGAITAAYIIYGEYSIPISWTAIDADETDVTMPSLSDFVATQSAERLRWYSNFTIRIEADEEYAESPNTNQIIAPSDDGSYRTTFVPRAIDSEISSYFVRASAGTDIAVDGTYSQVSSGTPAYDQDDGLILEDARTNLALRSSELDNASWSKNNCTITANAAMSPDGATGFDKIVEDSATAFHGVSQLLAVSSGQRYTQSFFVKAAERSWCMLTEGNNVTASAWFNLSTGTVGTVSGTGSPAATITSIGLGIYRVALSFTPISTVANVQVRPTTGDAISSYAGDGSSGIYAWGAQLEAGAFASSYIPTTTATVTRAASYLGPIPVGDMGIASQTNEYSFAFAWSPTYPSAAVPSGTYFWLGSLGATAANDRLSFYVFPSNSRVYAERINNFVYVGDVSTSDGELTWAANDIILTRISWSASSGLVMVNNKVGSANLVDTNSAAALKAAAPNAMTHLSLAAIYGGGSIQSTFSGAHRFIGFRVWDTALSQAELQALTTDDLIPVGKFGTAEAPPWGYPPSGAQEGDDVYGHKVSGESVVTPETYDVSVATAGPRVRFHTYDVSGGLWLDTSENAIPLSTIRLNFGFGFGF